MVEGGSGAVKTQRPLRDSPGVSSSRPSSGQAIGACTSAQGTVEPKWSRTQTTQGQFIFALILRRLILRGVGGYCVAVGGARGTAGGDSDGLVRYWRVPRGRCSLGSARTSKLVMSLRRVIVRWVLWRAFPLRSISRFGATPHGVPAGIGSGLARELHPLGLTNRLGYYGLVTLGDWGTVYQRLSGDTIKLPFGGWR